MNFFFNKTNELKTLNSNLVTTDYYFHTISLIQMNGNWVTIIKFFLKIYIYDEKK